MRGRKAAGKLGRAGAVAAALLATPSPAAAHTVFQGVGSLWSGAAHLLTSLDQLGFLLGLGIWTSFHEPRLDARVIAAILAALFAGDLIGAAVGGDNGALAAGLMTLAGLAGAARLRAGAAPVLGVAAFGGLAGAAAAGGAAAGPGLAGWPSAVLYAFGGSLAGGSVLSYGLLAARRLGTAWGSIALRAAASWIAAIGMMMLALSWARATGRV